MIGSGEQTSGDGYAGRAAAPAGATGPAGGVAAVTVPPTAAGTAAESAAAHLAAIGAAVAGLRDLPLWTIGQSDLLDLTRRVEATARSMLGVQVRVAGEIHERGVAGILDTRSTAHLLHDTLHITVSDARTRIAAARASLPTETVTGDTVAPTDPELLDAIDRGRISAGHVKVITRCLSKIPAAVDEQTRTLCADTLLDQAGQRDEVELRQVADQIGHIVDPDGSLSGKDPSERAEFDIGAKRDDGLTPVRGLLSPLTAERLRTAIEALAAPVPLDEHTPDPRPASLRREQALGEILHRHLTAGAGPRDGGVRPQVVVTVTMHDLLAGLHGNDPAAPGGQTSPGGSAWSDYDGIQSVAAARLLACDADIIPQILGPDSAVLDQGRAVRLFTAAQRRALTTRDRGCAFPACDIPPGWCQAHHITWWSRGGTTDIANGVLLCQRHHTLIHHGQWQIDVGPDGGRPWFVPPPHIDPTRQPRRNTHFHPPDLTAVVSRR